MSALSTAKAFDCTELGDVIEASRTKVNEALPADSTENSFSSSPPQDEVITGLSFAVLAQSETSLKKAQPDMSQNKTARRKTLPPLLTIQGDVSETACAQRQPLCAQSTLPFEREKSPCAQNSILFHRENFLRSTSSQTASSGGTPSVTPKAWSRCSSCATKQASHSRRESLARSYSSSSQQTSPNAQSWSRCSSCGTRKKSSVSLGYLVCSMRDEGLDVTGAMGGNLLRGDSWHRSFSNNSRTASQKMRSSSRVSSIPTCDEIGSNRVVRTYFEQEFERLRLSAPRIRRTRSNGGDREELAAGGQKPEAGKSSEEPKHKNSQSMKNLHDESVRFVPLQRRSSSDGDLSHLIFTDAAHLAMPH